jgi:arginine-tRNA-protein transferase
MHPRKNSTNHAHVFDDNCRNVEEVVTETKKSKKEKKETKISEVTSKPNVHKLEVMAAASLNQVSKVQTVRSKFTQEEFELYKRYQVSVHNDDPDDLTEKGYTGTFSI